MNLRHACTMTLAALALGACGGGSAQLGERALNVALGEDDLVFQGSRFAALRAAGQGPARDVRIEGTSVRGGFLREARQGTIETWLGTDGVTLIFDRGVLHGTRGIGAGLLASDVSATASYVLSGRSGQVERIHTFLDGNDLAVSRAFVCDISVAGSETITLDIGAVRTRKMVERCRNLDTEFENEYWVNESRGGIVQSRQWAGGRAGTLNIRNVYNF